MKVKKDIKGLIAQMTLEEKASFCSGSDEWHIPGLPRLGIPELMMTDGPHGLRKLRISEGSVVYDETYPATCFPSAAGLCCSWNRELVYHVGQALAAEAKAEQVSILLGPGVCMKRSPLCGRNFEYFSEDPYLAGQMGTAYVKGVQSCGVGTSLKHFAANNQEHRRYSTSANVDERTLREIYLPAFETVVKESHPATIMHSYNRINGKHTANCKWLLTDILRNEWGYEGFVMSDWNAMNNRVDAVGCGSDLEMPSSFGTRDRLVVQAVRDGELDERVLDTLVERILKVVFDYLPEPDAPKADLKVNHRLAAQVGDECMVLLKNEGGLLPLSAGKPLAVLGAFARKPRYQGGGSSHVNTAYVDDVFEFINSRNGIAAQYAPGYDLENDQPNPELIAEAVATAKACGRALLFVGLPDSYESEGRDRTHMRMPAAHNALIEAVADAVPETIVVMLAGSPAEMPWLHKVTALFHAYLGGGALGSAIAKILYGDVNPSGKVAETHPYRLEDNPTFLNFPGDGDDCNYAEGIYIGYRYYEKKKIPVMFPFGYGLSYTTFRYDSIAVDGNEVTVTLTNTGDRAGKEVIQLYVGANAPRVHRPVKELKDFAKVELAPGETKTVTFTLNDRSFSYWDVRVHDWRMETGDYTVYVGGCSTDTPLTAVVHREDPKPYIAPIHQNTCVCDLMTMEEYAPIRYSLLAKLYPAEFRDEVARLGLNIDNPMIRRRWYYPLRRFVVLRFGELDDAGVRRAIFEANRELGVL